MAKRPKSSAAEQKSLRRSTGDAEIGRRLAQARKAARLSGDDLASQLGVTKSAISQWEKGSVAIDNKHAAAISLILGVPIHLLLALPPGAEFLTPQERAMLDEFRRVSPERRESLLVILKGL